MGNRFIFLYRGGTLAATQALLLTPRGRPTGVVAPAKLPKPGEYRNGENRAKERMACRFRRVRPIPGAREKGEGKEPPRPYREPTQVPLGEKPQACRVEPGLGKSAN